MYEKIYKPFWAIVAFVVFAFATRAQVLHRTDLWPFDALMLLPTFLGDVVALTLFLGAGPLVLSFAFLVPTRSSLFAGKIAAALACLSAVINPISNSAFNLRHSGNLLDLSTLLANGLTLLGAAVPIFFFIVFVPQIIIKLLKRRI